MVVGLLVVVLACTENGGGPAGSDGGDVEPDLALQGDVETDAGRCAGVCQGKECGEVDGCVCGLGFECGMSNKYECNQETYQCECQPLCGPIPDFWGWECGDDGCGGSCGTCPDETFCDYSDDQSGDGREYTAAGGYCVTCAERCEALELECGVWPTGITRVPECDCGSCPEGMECFDGRCDCVPDCAGRQCGGDGCGGSCGACPGAADICSVEGTCVCQPQCAGKVCGGDGCGGQCGVACSGSLVCVDGQCVTCLVADDCDDGSECTVDSCEAGECVYGEEEGPCDDSNSCTQDDSCVAGACVGQPLVCDDGNECTDDGCEPADGCRHLATSGGDCDGGAGKCVDGACLDKVPSCADGWTLASGRCFRPFDPDGDETLDWYAAEALCQGLGGHLAAIHDEETNELVKSLVAKTNFTDDTTWIGLSDETLEGVWTWTDGSAVDFLAWAGGQPNNWAGCWFGKCPQNCVAIGDPMIGFGGWDDLECEELHRYICEREADWD